MKIIVCLALLIPLLGLNSCGVSKLDYEKVVAEREQLLAELDMYKNGEQRLLALIQQDLNNGDIASAKRNIATLTKYHPESVNKQETKTLLTAVENEEARIAKAAADKESAENAAKLERQQGFSNSNAATAKKVDTTEAAYLKSTKKLKNGEYFIIRPCYFGMQRGSTIWIKSSREDTNLDVESDQLYKLLDGTRISVLLQATNANELKIIELQQY